MSNAFFNPAPDRLLVVINDLIDPELSLREVATRHNTSIAALSLWLALPDTTQQLAIFHSAFTDRIRLLATSNLAASVSTITRLLDRFRQSEAAPDPSLTPEQRQRGREFALRAATLLVRLANYRPTVLGTPPREIAHRPSTSPAPAGEVSRAQQATEGGRMHAPPTSPLDDSMPRASIRTSPAPAGEVPSAAKAEGVRAHSTSTSPLDASMPRASMPSSPLPPDFLPTSDEDDSLLATAGPAPHEHWP